MRRVPHVPRDHRDHQMEHMIERLLRADGHKMQDKLHHHSGAPVREKSSLGRRFVLVKTV